MQRVQENLYGDVEVIDLEFKLLIEKRKYEKNEWSFSFGVSCYESMNNEDAILM